MLKFSMLVQSYKMSVSNIRHNKMRSFLTMLGIIIGVAAVIALITTISGVTEYMMGQFSSMGAGSLSVSVTGTPLKFGLSETDLESIAAIENVKSISPTVSVSTRVVHDGKVSDACSVSGKSEEYFRHNSALSLGRPLMPSDMSGTVNVCVVDTTAAKVFFTGKNPLDSKLRIGGVEYTVIGVVGEDDNISVSFGTGAGDDGMVYIPYKNALHLNNTNSVSALDVYVEDTDRMDETVSALKSVLKNAFNQNENAYFVFNMESLLSTMNTMSNMMTTMLAGIASIALLVGGIGIMNMMLTSVAERTKEIGLRKALGAEPRMIQLQFLTESVLLSLSGGLIGIVLGEIMAAIATAVIGTQFRINLSAILLGFFFSLAVGVIFGWAPARRASRLNPIDALRTE